MVPGLVPGSDPPALTSCHWDHHHKTDLLQPGAPWHPTLSLSLSLSWRKLVPQCGQLGPPLCEEISQEILGGTEVKQLSSVENQRTIVRSYFHLRSDLNLLATTGPGVGRPVWSVEIQREGHQEQVRLRGERTLFTNKSGLIKSDLRLTRTQNSTVSSVIIALLHLQELLNITYKIGKTAHMNYI